MFSLYLTISLPPTHKYVHAIGVAGNVCRFVRNEFLVAKTPRRCILCLQEMSCGRGCLLLGKYFHCAYVQGKAEKYSQHLRRSSANDFSFESVAIPVRDPMGVLVLI